MNDGLPPGLTEADLPFHHRGQWTTDTHLPSPDGQHVVTLYAINEERMGYLTCRALWSRRDTPRTFLGTIEQLPLMQFAHWIDNARFALKLYAHNRDWVRPMVVIDLSQGFTVLPHSNGPAPDLTLLASPTTGPFQPFSEAALGVETDLTHLL